MCTNSITTHEYNHMHELNHFDQSVVASASTRRRESEKAKRDGTSEKWFDSYIDVDKMRVCRRTAALFFPDARLMRQPSPIDVALKVGWSSVFGVGLQQPTFIGSQQEKTDDQQTNAKKTDDQLKICYNNWRGSIRWPSAIRLSVVRPFY